MVVIIDNYDSFSYNLYQLAGCFDKNALIIQNSEKLLSELIALNPSHIIISSGRESASHEAMSEKVIEYFKGKCPILGVCFGHHTLCRVFGAMVSHASRVIHGESLNIHIANGSEVFRGLPPIIQAGMYHSLSVKRNNLPDELLIIDEDEHDEIMAVKHRDYEIYGLQFHPESVLTPQGSVIIGNFLSVGRDSNRD